MRPAFPAAGAALLRQSVLAETVALQNSSTTSVAWLLAAIASISMVVGGIGIFKIMLVSVSERTRETGLRAALGATRRDIARLFLFEALLLCPCCSALGVCLGMAGSCAMAEIAGWPALVAPVRRRRAHSPFHVPVGTAFGYYPPRKAATLEPAAALRSD